jgi:acyl carrier protein
VYDAVERLAATLAPVPVPRAYPDQTLVDDLGYHSLRLLELILALEELFDVETTMLAEAPPIGTVGELAGYVAELVCSADATLPAGDVIEEFLRQQFAPLDEPIE